MRTFWASVTSGTIFADRKRPVQFRFFAAMDAKALSPQPETTAE
jgi:hypothetical protein